MTRALFALAAVVAAAGCKTVAHGDVYEGLIEAQLEAEGKPAEVECPDRIPLGRISENHFACVLVWQRSTQIPVLIALDDKGGWHMQPQ